MRMLLTIALWLLPIAAIDAKVITYPAPPAERQATPYQVQANDRQVDVYSARTLDPPFAKKQWNHGGTYSFASFDMSGPVVVKITSQRSLRNTVIRPASASIQPVFQDDHTLTIQLDKPRKLSVEPDGKNGPLLLFANPPEVDPPNPNSAHVVYFGPGVHKPNRIELGDNQILYLAGGAVVKAEVLVQGDHVRIRGRGILDGSDWAWRSGPVGNLIAIRDSHDVEVSGITLRGSSHWTIVPKHSQNVTIRNVKLCNSRVQNDDGINPCNSQDVLITDCFIRSDDDCVALKGLDFRGDNNKNNNVERITVENSVLWCDRARIFLLGHESRAEFMRDVTLRNLDIIHFTMTAFLFEPGENMTLQNIKIQDVRIHGEGQRSLIRLRPVVNQYMRTKIPGYIRDVRFENVTVTGQAGEYLVQLQGADPEHDVVNVTFQGVTILGKPLDADTHNVQIGNNVRDVKFGSAAEPDRP